MKVVVNAIDVTVSFAEVEVSLDSLTRQFTIKNTEDDQSFFLNDEVEIYDNAGKLLIKAVVEYVAIEQEKKFIYAGRNNAKYIVDCYADKTIQFSENQTVQTVLEEIASNFDLKVIGEAKMPKDTIKTILIGENLGKSFMKIAKNAGQILTSDASGNIEIEKESLESAYIFSYGENIRARTFKADSTNEYDRYIVVSQSNYLTKQNQESNVWGEFGTGKFVKVIRSEDNLSEKECEELAKIEYYKDRRKSVEYSVEVDNNILVDVNTTYLVIDPVAKINTMMKVKKYVSSFNINSDKLIVTFEKTKDD